MKIKTFLSLLATVAALWLLLTLSIYSLQRFIIFQAEPLPENHSFQFDFPFTELFLTTPDSVQLNALYFPQTTDAISPKGAILYFHGNADNLQRWGQYSPDLTQRGYDVLMIDYRNYGKSGGWHDEAAYYRDAQMAYDWLLQKFSAEEIIIYGRSLGASIASELATKVEAKLLILETPFDNIQHAIETAIPVLWLPYPLKYQFANDRHLPLIDYPIYIFHGTKDQVVPYRSAKALKPLLKVTDHFYTIEGGGHKNLGEFLIFQERLNEIL